MTPDFICHTQDGPCSSSACDLTALLDLLDQVAPVAGLVARLAKESPHDRFRRSWVRARFESVDGTWSAVVDEDLAPLTLPYSRDIIEGRALLDDDPIEPAPAVDTTVQVSRAGGPSGSATRRPVPPVGRRVLVANLLGHADIQDSDLAELEWEVSPTGAMALRNIIGGPANQLESARVGPVLAASLHALVSVGARVSQWTREQSTLDDPDFASLLDIVDRNGIRQDLARELVEANRVARLEWRGGASNSRVRARDDMDHEEESWAEARRRY